MWRPWLQARQALTDAPQAAQFKWRASCEWKNGTHSHSTVEGFYGLGQEQARKKNFTFDADHPEVFASEDLGPRRSSTSWWVSPVA